MRNKRLFFLFLMFAWLLSGCQPPLPPQQPISHPLPANETYRDCYKLTAADVTPILAESVSTMFSTDSLHFQCVFVSEREHQATLAVSDRLLPTYGTYEQRHYVAVIVLADYTSFDPMDEFVDALFWDESTAKQAFVRKFDNDFWGAEALAKLATVSSPRYNAALQFLPDVGEGALWVWQTFSTGQHLATIYVPYSVFDKVIIQSFVAADRSEADTQREIMKLIAHLNTLPGVMAQP